MQRFRLMKVYVASVVLVLIAAMAGVAWFRGPQAAATRTDADALAVRASAMRPADDNAPAHADAMKRPNIFIDNFTFTPREISVAVGATVTWVNRDDVPHTATSNDDPTTFDSKALDTDDKYSFTFTKPGTYRYYCKVHPHMIGSVIVK